ncbi:MAG TPA: 3-deoxy-7-phosphoheptulonate synthase [Candidatus Limadaptatus stercoripullorum]|uniref:3-deoxy-7-phosphoheptulonate synthase n=1 Tax=Candidatus Limadaptatus stercoripullorum TaxID=2840846 RepID=A0A9D1N8M6_9FIRM|nr:3-deoxy-7-phosphoheptulonate synthase [Candidatus Limadaptatus stercoripullorum]
MIIVVKNDPDKKQMDNLVRWIKGLGLDIHMSRGADTTIMGLIGDTSVVDVDLLRSLDIVESVRRIQEPFKNANRKFHPEDTVVDIGGHKFGGGHFQLIAGPCAVESAEQFIAVAKAVKAAGATVLRGGAFKPRTSPYAFQGLREEGLRLLSEAKRETGMPVCTEIVDAKYLPLYEDVDLIQVGARNMQNFELLKELGKSGKPILLKRGLAATVEEWLMSAEYIMSEGNNDIILCERDIRTFEPYTRNTLDLSAIPVLKELTHLPVLVDPSHASGHARLVLPLSLAAVGAGAQGLEIEVHNDPPHALSDGAQSLRPEQFEDLVRRVDVMLPVVGKERDK